MPGMNVVAQLIDRFSNPANPRGTSRGDAYMAKRIPDFAAAVMDGKVFEVLGTTTNAALVARPTTVSGVTVQNPASSGKWYVIYGLKMYTDLVAATLGTVSVWHCAHKLAAAALTRDIVLQGTGAGTAMCLKAGVNYGGVAIFDNAATVVDDGWIPTELSLVSNIATTNFQANAVKLSVPVIIPPSFHYSLQTTATVVGFESSLGFTWGEFDEDDLY